MIIKLVRDIHVRIGCYANYLRYASWIDEPNDDTINNSNWTEWSGIRAEIIRVISKSNERAAWVQFEITSMISDQIARHEVQLLLYYIHFEIAQIQDLVSSDILWMQFWAGLKLN